MNLSTCKRVVLFNIKDKPEDREDLDKDDGNAKQDKSSPLIEFRHYGVSARQRAVNRGIKKIVNNQKVPNLAKYKSIQDFIFRNKKRAGASSSGDGADGTTADSLGAYSSESEIDDLPRFE